IEGIDPDGVIIIAAWRALDRGETLSRVGGLVGRGIRNVDDILIARVNTNASEVRTTASDATFGIHAMPALARVIGSINRAGPRFDQRVHAIRIARRDRDADSAKSIGRSRKSVRESRPSRPAVSRFE